MARQVVGDLGPEPRDPGGERLERGAEVGADHWALGLGHAVLLLCFHPLELVAPIRQFSQRSPCRILWQMPFRLPFRPKPGQHAGIHPVRLGQVQGLREVPGKQRIEPDEGPVQGRKRLEQRKVATGRRLKDENPLGAAGLEKRSDPGGGIGIGCGTALWIDHVEPILGNVAPNIVLWDIDLLSMSACSERDLRHMQLFRLVRPTGGGPIRETGETPGRATASPPAPNIPQSEETGRAALSGASRR
jgi:hypothetical protein